MAEVIPFKGILYNPEKVSGDDVIAPPYDIITPEYRETLYQKSPFNIVRVDFGKEMPEDTEKDNRYTRARNYLEEWLREGVLTRDDESSFYAYEVDYLVNNEKKTLRGIIGLVKIEELGKGVYPHEETHSKPKTDRLNLMRACLANISPIYALYNSKDKITSGIISNIMEKPHIAASDQDGALHKIFRISDKSKIDLIKRELSDKDIFIADGHHRYEVALEFKKEMGSGPWDYVMMFLANMSDEGITILPTHRLVKGISEIGDTLSKLEDDFEITELPMDIDIVKEISNYKKTFGLYLDRENSWYALKYRGNDLKDIHPAIRELDVVILHELILKRDLGITSVAYEMNQKEAIHMVNAGKFDAAFFLNPTGVRDVERVALSNLRMPPKSTYFYPKLLTGMVINRFSRQ